MKLKSVQKTKSVRFFYYMRIRTRQRLKNEECETRS
jgi:hypothetical protein